MPACCGLGGCAGGAPGRRRPSVAARTPLGGRRAGRHADLGACREREDRPPAVVDRCRGTRAPNRVGDRRSRRARPATLLAPGRRCAPHHPRRRRARRTTHRDPGVRRSGVRRSADRRARRARRPVLLVIDDLHELAADGGAAPAGAPPRPPTAAPAGDPRDPPRPAARAPSTPPQRRAGRAARRGSPLHGRRDIGAPRRRPAFAVSDETAARLQARTEGWAAGLRLAALSLAGRRDPERFVAEFSGSERTVADYLLAEVLESQPQDVRTLLLRTSILDRVCGPLADGLLGTTGSERILLALEASNAFVTAVDSERVWFRYHQLFADLLRLELRRTSPELLPVLHRAAAEWYAEHGQMIDAVRHLQAAEDWRVGRATARRARVQPRPRRPRQRPSTRCSRRSLRRRSTTLSSSRSWPTVSCRSAPSRPRPTTSRSPSVE